jgi:GMP synthase-like glutamine amidotransferase
MQKIQTTRENFITIKLDSEGIKTTVYRKMRIVCFKHVPFEGPAAFSDWAESRGHKLKCFEVYQGDALPATGDYDMLLVMGGPMNIYEETKYPWLSTEKSAIREAIHAGKYVVGVCLGAQLIADLLGGPVKRGVEVEIGWFPIERSEDCPTELPLPMSLRVYHWHGDTFAIPEGATRLCSSAACANQGFLYQGRVLGLQCHLETTRESMSALIKACADEIWTKRFIQTKERMHAEPDETFVRMQSVLFDLLDQITRDG